MIRQTLHGTAISYLGKGLLFLGKSGSGKSDLALRLIEKGAVLIADDVVCAVRDERGKVLLSPLPENKGLIELFGIGIYRTDFTENHPLDFVFNLDGFSERLPESKTYRLFDSEFPILSLSAFHESTTTKVSWYIQKKSLPLDVVL